MAWGHDEYMYQVLQGNACRLPEIGMAIVRYHSFYAWHTDDEYRHLASESDQDTLRPWIRAFNAFDLYSKEDAAPADTESLWRDYYEPLCQKYNIGGTLRW